MLRRWAIGRRSSVDGRLSRAAAAILVALVALALYRSTLLPDFDLGDSPSFQVMAGEAVITPRDGYPLYYAIGRLFTPFGASRAHAMNLASAVQAAVACGVIVLVAAELSGSLLAAIAAALLFAGSYTFWSQAVIAEVYALHILLVALTLLLLLRWSRRPTRGRLAWFFAAYAISFGNHLSMILLAPAYAVFLLAVAPAGWRSLLAPRIVGMALALAVLGALPYLWNFRALWLAPTPPNGLADALGIFWFDVTKADWRDTMVLAVPPVMAVERVRMYGFDVVQQFGRIAPLVALAGAVHMIRTDWRRAILVIGIFGVTVLFALGYNVGDAHVFLLPPHLMLALLAAPGIVLIERAPYLRGASVLVIAMAGWNIVHDYPALDRSEDTRPAQVLSALTNGLDDRHAVLLTDLDWQIQNGLTYFGDQVRPELAYARLADVLLYLPALVRDNVTIGRDVVVTERARHQIDAAYGPLLQTLQDPRVPVVTLEHLTRDLARGTRYVLCVLKPSREFVIDAADLHDALRRLTGDRVGSVGQDGYSVVAGLVGDEPALLRSSIRPFRQRVRLDGVAVDVRMESWLEFDTIRRMGFGHIIAHGARRHHALIVERGVSFVALDATGQAVRSGYTAGIYASQPRYLIRR
jgi:MFS family permease